MLQTFNIQESTFATMLVLLVQIPFLIYSTNYLVDRYNTPVHLAFIPITLTINIPNRF